AAGGGTPGYAGPVPDRARAPLCLGARGGVAGPAGRRELPLSALLAGFYETALEPAEIITAIRVPAPPAAARSGYVKFCPRSLEDKPLIGVAALVVLDGGGRCREARVALGAAAPPPRGGGPARGAAAERAPRHAARAAR